MNNALDHGAFPINIIINEVNNQIKISIQDAGKLKIDNCDEIWNEFVKGNQSKGTGLGLNIAKKVIKETGGKIELSTNPTCFNLTLTPGKKELENG